MTSKSKSDPAGRAFETAWSGCWGVLFFVPGVALCFYALGLDSYRYFRGADARSWPTTIGRIDRSGFRDVEGRRSYYNPRRRYDPENVVTRYEPLVEYSYAVNGRRYRNDRIWLIGRVWRFENPEQVEYFVRGLRPNAVRVIYDPDDPGDSALLMYSGVEPGFWTSLVSVPVGLAFAWAGFLILRSARRSWVGHKRVTNAGGDTTSPP